MNRKILDIPFEFIDKEYFRIVDSAYNGYDVEPKDERTSVGTVGGFCNRLLIPSNETGLLTTRYINPKTVIAELCWFLSGSTNINELDSHIWDEWADEDGSIGPMYGKQLRNVSNNKTGERVDQLKRLVDGIIKYPYSRRHLISTFNSQDVDQMALWPCHGLVTQFSVHDDFLHMFTYQRSADVLVGLPFNLASYSLLLHLVARETNYKPGYINYQLGDYHIYKNQVSNLNKWVDKLLEMPAEVLNNLNSGQWVIDPDFDMFEPEDSLIQVQGYSYATKASFPVNV